VSDNVGRVQRHIGRGSKTSEKRGDIFKITIYGGTI